MGATVRPSTGALVAALLLSVFVLLVWLVLLSWLTSLNDSDAAGNGMSQAFAAIGLVFEWVLLAVLMLVAGLGGHMPTGIWLPALILIPASGVVALTAEGLLSEPQNPPYYWPMVEPAIAPPLIVALALWSMMPPLRRAAPTWLAGAATWSTVTALCLATLPMSNQRDAYKQRIAEDIAKSHAAFAALPADAPLSQWTPFLVINGPDTDAALMRIRQLPNRQAETKALLARGDFPLRYLIAIDVTPTAALCAAARAELRKRVTPRVLATPQSKPYLDIWLEVNGALSAMAWLAKAGCPIKAEAAQWEAMAGAYRDTNFDVIELRQLRDGTY